MLAFGYHRVIPLDPLLMSAVGSRNESTKLHLGTGSF